MYSPVITAPVCCHEFVMKREEEEGRRRRRRKRRADLSFGRRRSRKEILQSSFENYLTLSSAHFVHRWLTCYLCRRQSRTDRHQVKQLKKTETGSKTQTHSQIQLQHNNRRKWIWNQCNEIQGKGMKYTLLLNFISVN